MSNSALSTASSETHARLFAAKIDLLARQIPALAAGSTFLAVGSAFILYLQGLPVARIVAWLAVFVVFTAGRVGVYRIYKSRPRPPESAPRWAAILAFLSFLAGVIWGSLGVLFFVPDDPFTLALVTIILAGILASALNSLGPYWPAHVAFGIPCAVPFAIVCLASGRPPLITLGALSLFFLVFTELFARSIARSIEQSLQLRFENLELVADLKAARDRAESADLAKTRLLAAVSHDLRQPLHGMGLLAEAMEEQVLDLSAAEFPQAPIMVEVAQRMRTDFGAMEQLVNRLLEASRLQDGTVRVKKRPIALAGLLESVASTAGEVARAKGLRLRLAARQEQVHTDPDLLYSVVANLVSNAVKYTRTGGVLLACRRRGGRVRIEVWDTGIGIAPDELDLIQGEYYRARNADEGGARAGGFGLGLSIVNRTAALLDLRLDVRSRLGRGSVFAVELPAEQVVPGEESERLSLRT